MRRLVTAALGAAFVSLGAASAAPLAAQAGPPDPVGDWEGALDAGGTRLPVVFHVTRGDDGALAATLDSPSQGAFGIPGGDVVLSGDTLRIAVPAVAGGFEGVFSAGGAQIRGTWSQGGGRLPLVLTRSGAAPDEGAAPAVATEDWAGQLKLPNGAELRIVFHISRGEAGPTATLDSPDQGAFGTPTGEVEITADSLRIAVPMIAGEYRGAFGEDGRTIDGTWTQNGMAMELDLERVEGEAAAPPRRPQNPEGPLPYEVREVEFPNEEAGHALAGTLTLPRGEGPFPAAVLISGSGPQDRDESLMGHRPFLVLADHLTRAGIAVLRYDDRGVGGSGGVFATATTADFASDALAAVSYLGTVPEVAAGSIGLVGHSEGGLVAPMASVRSDDVAWLVLLAGTGLTGEEILYLQGRLIARAAGADEERIDRQERLQRALFGLVKTIEDEDELKRALRARLETAIAEATPEERSEMGAATEAGARAFIDGQVGQITSPWFRYFLTYDPVPLLERVDVPVLALNGELDLQVPPGPNLENIEAALRRGGNERVTALELPGLNHLFQTAETGAISEYARIEETMAPAALEAVSSWILRTTGG